MPIELDPKKSKAHDLFADMKGTDFDFDPLKGQKEIHEEINALYQAAKSDVKAAEKMIKTLETDKSKGYTINLLYSVRSKLQQDPQVNSNPKITTAIAYIDREISRRNKL